MTPSSTEISLEDFCHIMELGGTKHIGTNVHCGDLPCQKHHTTGSFGRPRIFPYGINPLANGSPHSQLVTNVVSVESLYTGFDTSDAITGY